MKALDAPKKKFMENTLPKMLFGCGVIDDLHTYELPGKKAMITTTGEQFYVDCGYYDRLTKQLDLAGVEWVIFDKIRPNPLKEMINEGGEFARENNVDFIISFGGGGCHDSSKSIAVAAINEGDIWDYIGDGTGGGKPISNGSLPVVCITLTAGTGSETNAGAVINNAETNEKLSLKGPFLFPKYCIVDPELMVSCPPRASAMMGFDAMTHAFEAYFGKNADYMSDMYNETSIKHIYPWLPKVVADPSNLEAREHVAMGAHLAGRGMIHGSLGMHAMEHGMSGYYIKLPHGLGLAMIFREYYKKLIEHGMTNDRFIQMAEIMGKEGTNDPFDFLAAMDELMAATGLDQAKMSDFGITEEDFPKFIEKAHLMERLMVQEQPMLTDDEWMDILKKSYK